MSLKRIDEAMVKKLERVFPNVKNAQEDRVSDMVDDKAELALPLITVWRVANPLAFGELSNDTMVRRGFWHQESDEEGVLVKGLPVRVQYQIDIISDKREEVDDLFREVAMYLYTEGTIKVDFLVKDGVSPIPREFTLRVLDNNPATDYASFSDKGKLYKESINVEVPNAELLFVEGLKTVREIPIRVYTMSRDGDLLVESN